MYNIADVVIEFGKHFVFQLFMVPRSEWQNGRTAENYPKSKKIEWRKNPPDPKRQNSSIFPHAIYVNHQCWHLFQNQPLLSEIFKDTPIIPYQRKRSLKVTLIQAKLQFGYYSWVGVIYPVGLSPQCNHKRLTRISCREIQALQNLLCNVICQ